HQRFRRIVRYKISRDLPGQMSRGGRMVDEDIDRLVHFGQPPSLDGVTKENLVTIIMPGRIEFERALPHELRLQLRLELGIFRLQINSDTRQNTSQRLDIRLRVT